MKGIILAGGAGTRLDPSTRVTNKHLLPVYDRPMIMFPLAHLRELGLKDIMIVTSIDYVDHFYRLLGDKFEGANLRYAVQDKPGGIAQALSMTEHYVENDSVAVILGDNIYEKPVDISRFEKGARIFLKEVDDPQRFGVATLLEERVVSVVEKPKNPETNFAVTGFYLYDNTVFNKIRGLKPSDRGELEITDVNNAFISEGTLSYRFVNGFWTDAGTKESLFRAATLVRGTTLENRES